MPPQGNKSPLVPPSKLHTFLRKRTDASPSSARTSVPFEVRISQSTNSLGLRNNENLHDEFDLPDENSREFVHPLEDDEDIFDDDKTPEERAAAELRANKRRGYDPDSTIEDNNESFLSGAGSLVSSTPSLEKSIKKKKVQSDSPDSRDSDDRCEFRRWCLIN